MIFCNIMIILVINKYDSKYSNYIIGRLGGKKMKKILLIMSLVVMVALTGCVSEHDHDEEHDHSVEIEGSVMKSLTVQEVADLWKIDSEVFLSRIIAEFDLKESYTVNTVLEDIREEYAFSPALIKDMAEDIKQKGLQNE